MLNFVLIYSKDDCPWCVRARDFLREKNVSNVAELKVNVDITVKDFRRIAEENNQKSTVPLIFYRTRIAEGWKVLGGYEDLVKYYENKP